MSGFREFVESEKTIGDMQQLTGEELETLVNANLIEGLSDDQPRRVRPSWTDDLDYAGWSQWADLEALQTWLELYAKQA